jgi:hypothetical protein
MCSCGEHTDEYEYRIGFQWLDGTPGYRDVSICNLAQVLTFWSTHNRFLLAGEPWTERRVIAPWRRVRD